MCFNRVLEENEEGSPLLATGGQNRPDSFTPTLTPLTSRALSDLSINDHKTDCLLGQIVCWLDAGGRDEPEVRIAVLAETLSQILSFDAIWGTLCRPNDVVSCLF